jgi:hypothetical protein
MIDGKEVLRQAPAAPELEQWGLTHREVIEIEGRQKKPHRKLRNF